MHEEYLTIVLPEVDKSTSSSRWRDEWHAIAEKPTLVDVVENTVSRGSLPSFAFYFMPAISAVIATLGLLANSAAVVIGAMIVAPIMSPIIALSYGLVSGTGPLILRSTITVFTGTLLRIAVAFRQDIIAEVGLAFETFSPRGPFLLYVTYFIGIIFAGGVVFSHSTIDNEGCPC